jgi:hypothetical protein
LVLVVLSLLEIKLGKWTEHKAMGLRTALAALMGLAGVIAVTPSADAETVSSFRGLRVTGHLQLSSCSTAVVAFGI